MADLAASDLLILIEARAKIIPLVDLLSSSLMSLWDGRVFAQQSEIRLSLVLCLGIGLEIGLDNMTF